MVVQVHWKRGQLRPRSKARFSLLGDGMLERTRSTTLGLLGMIAAVGLAIIAVALQGNWPLVAGSPVPRAPALHEAVGDAEALGAKASSRIAHGPSPRRRRTIAAHRGGSRPPGSAPVASVPAASTELVVSPSVPAKPQSGGHRGSRNAPAPPTQAPPTAQQAPSAAAPAPQPSPAVAAPPPSAPAQTPPPQATASEAPSTSDVPPWSNGQGHAYGREDDRGHGHSST